MANIRNLGQAMTVTVFPTTAGTVINGAAGGTVNGASLSDAEYHSVMWVGTFANNGTLNVYACTNAGGSNPIIIRSLAFGSSNAAAQVVDVKSSALGSATSALGTTYTHLGAYGTVESGGTVRGVIQIISTSLRVSPPTSTYVGSGIGSYGTYLT